MLTIIIILLVIPVIGALVVTWMVSRAPWGWEDEQGYHDGVDPRCVPSPTESRCQK